MASVFFFFGGGGGGAAFSERLRQRQSFSSWLAFHFSAKISAPKSVQKMKDARFY